MKKTLSILLSLIMLLSITVGLEFSANAATSGNYAYSQHADGTAEITEYRGFDSTLEIPSTLDGYKVTSIGASAFAFCDNLESVTIPNTVTSIGESAFSLCSNLKSITIPNTVTSIGDGAFGFCENLISITIPDSVTSIGESILSGCESLKSIIVDTNNKYYDSRNNCNAIIKTSDNALLIGCQNTTIPNTVTSISNSAFGFCTGLKSITIPANVKIVGDFAFACCIELKSVTILNGVTKLGEGAFGLCSELKSITIPASVTSIGEGAFSGCLSLKSIAVASNNKKYSSSNGVLYNKSKTALIQYPVGSKSTSYIIPKTIKSISETAFSACSNLKDLYYSGTLAQWNKISKNIDTESLKNIMCKSDGVWVNINQKKASVKKLTNAKKSFKATWKKVSGVTGYQIQYSTSKKFTKKTTKSVTISSNKSKSPSKTVKKLKGQKIYYVRIRTYKNVKFNGKMVKVYSSWSKAKTVTTKK